MAGLRQVLEKHRDIELNDSWLMELKLDYNLQFMLDYFIKTSRLALLNREQRTRVQTMNSIQCIKWMQFIKSNAKYLETVQSDRFNRINYSNVSILEFRVKLLIPLNVFLYSFFIQTLSIFFMKGIIIWLYSWEV